jgi:hypothetical protein
MIVDYIQIISIIYRYQFNKKEVFNNKTVNLGIQATML